MHYEKIPFKFMNKKNRTLCKIRKECGKRRFPAALALLSGLRRGDGYAIGRDDLGLVGEDFAADSGAESCQRQQPASAPKAQAPQRRAFTFEIFLGVIQPDFVGFQKPIECLASLQPKQLPQLCFRQPASFVFFQRKSFQGTTREITPGSGESLRDIVWDVQGDFHELKSSTAKRIRCRCCRLFAA